MMNIKPHVHRGRFYNNAHDSILFRISNFLRFTCRATKHALMGKRGRKAIMGREHTPQSWTVKPELLAQSYDPVVTWIGHATFLIQLDNINIITDPVFYDLSVLAQRLVQAAASPEELPKIDAIIISHNHRDHVDERSLEALRHHQPLVCVPMGDKQWFVKRGFINVIEMTWGEQAAIGGVKLTFLPAFHWTGRSVFDINKSLWGSWMIEASGFTTYFAGDSAYGAHFAQIGREYPVIDLALMPVGPNEPHDLIADAHVSAEESVQGFLELGAQHFIPMHWGTFVFGLDSFYLPIQRLNECWKAHASKLNDKSLHVIKFGQQRKFVMRRALQNIYSENTQQIG